MIQKKNHKYLKLNKEEYSIINSYEYFELRGKQQSHNLTKLVKKSGVNAGLTVKVISVTHLVTFCKVNSKMILHSGWRVLVEIIDDYYRSGERYVIMIPKHKDLYLHLSEHYTLQ